MKEGLGIVVFPSRSWAKRAAQRLNLPIKNGGPTQIKGIKHAWKLYHAGDYIRNVDLK